jgi:hypothetical protein
LKVLRRLRGMPPATRRALLQVLSAPDEVRADAIRRFNERDEVARDLAEVLMDLEADELLREEVVSHLEASLWKA